MNKVREREPQMDAKRVKLVALIEHLDAGIGKGHSGTQRFKSV